MRSTPIYEVHAVKYAHLPRKAWEVQITPDPHDADFPMDYFVWLAIPLDESGHRTIGGKPVVIDTGFNAQVGKKRGREVKTNPADLIEHLGVDATVGQGLEEVRRVPGSGGQELARVHGGTLSTLWAGLGPQGVVPSALAPVQAVERRSSPTRTG